MPDSNFLFVVCQVGVEPLCKTRMAEQYPELRFAFSRPGFLTFKLPEGVKADSFDIQNAFVRTWGASEGRLEGDILPQAAKLFWEQVDLEGADQVHVWQRDAKAVGDRFEPFPSELTQQAAKAIKTARPSNQKRFPLNQPAKSGQTVLDCVLVEPHQWWFGRHRATTIERSWPGGVPPLKPPESMVSRAYLKMHEAIAWSRLPYQAKDECVEIGSSPGGAAQALLEYGLTVIGVDPAEMAPQIAEHPNFRHIRKRGRDVRRIEFANARWLMSDSNVTPQQTLDTVEDIVTNERVHIRGMLLTLKMPDWKLIDQLPQYLERIRGWGYRYVRPRHLAFNRQELCIAAFRSKSVRRFG